MKSIRHSVPPHVAILHSTYFNSLLFVPIAVAKLIARFLPNLYRPNGTHMNLAPEPVNSLLYHLFRLERFLVPWFSLPFGISLLLVLRKQDDRV